MIMTAQAYCIKQLHKTNNQIKQNYYIKQKLIKLCGSWFRWTMPFDRKKSTHKVSKTNKKLTWASPVFELNSEKYFILYLLNYKWDRFGIYFNWFFDPENDSITASKHKFYKFWCTLLSKNLSKICHTTLFGSYQNYQKIKVD